MEVQRAWRLESVALKNSMKRHTSPALKGSNPALLEEHEEQNQSTDFTPWNTQLYKRIFGVSLCTCAKMAEGRTSLSK